MSCCVGAWVLEQESINELRMGFRASGVPENTSAWIDARLAINTPDGDSLLLMITDWDHEYVVGEYGRVVFTVTAANVASLAGNDVVLGIVQQKLSTDPGPAVWKTRGKQEITIGKAKTS